MMEMEEGGAMLHGSAFWRDNPATAYSCNALAFRMAEFDHPVENTDADLCFSLLIVEASCLEFRRYHSLPPAHLGLNSTALIVAGGFLPSHPAAVLDFRNMVVANRRV